MFGMGSGITMERKLNSLHVANHNSTWLSVFSSGEEDSSDLWGELKQNGYLEYAEIPQRPEIDICKGYRRLGRASTIFAGLRLDRPSYCFTVDELIEDANRSNAEKCHQADGLLLRLQHAAEYTGATLFEEEENKHIFTNCTVMVMDPLEIDGKKYIFALSHPKANTWSNSLKFVEVPDDFGSLKLPPLERWGVDCEFVLQMSTTVKICR